MQIDRRFLMIVGAALLIIIIAYSSGIMGNGEEPPSAPTEQPAQTQ